MSICEYTGNEGCDLPSSPNDLKVLMCGLRREVDKLMKDTEATLLLQNR